MKQNQDRIFSIGKHTYGTQNIDVYYWGEGTHVEIGAFCSMSGYILLYLGGNHRTDWATTFPFGHTSKETFTSVSGKGHPTTKGNVIIGNDVWIGTSVTIMSGVKIGDGACIATNSVVTKDVPPYTIVGGNPAKIIKQRFTDAQIAALLELQWWELDDKTINEIAPLLCSPDVDALISRLREIRGVETTTKLTPHVIRLNKETINSIDLQPLHKFLVGSVARQYFLEQAGVEHYKLLGYLSTLFSGVQLVDVGTYQAASAVALAHNPDNKVLSYDIDQSTVWFQAQLPNIEYRLTNILFGQDTVLINTPLIFLDTAHTGEFEKLFYDKLCSVGYKGILVADDIHLNDPMKAWWASIQQPKYDVTKYGHHSGTGVVLFGNQEIICE